MNEEKFHLYGCPLCTSVYFHGDGFDESTEPCNSCGFDPDEDDEYWVYVNHV